MIWLARLAVMSAIVFGADCLTGQAQEAQQGVVSGRIVGSPGTVQIGDPQGYGFYTHISISHETIVEAISGVCERSCDAPGSSATIATWVIRQQDRPNQPTAPPVGASLYMTFGAQVPTSAALGAGAAVGIADYLKNQQAAAQYSDAVKKYTEQRIAQERAAVQQLQSGVSAFEAQTSKLQLESLSSVAYAFSQIPSEMRSESAIAKYEDYDSLSASPFVTKQLTYDPVTAKYALKELQARLSVKDYESAVKVADGLYHSNHRADLSALPPGSIDDGIVRIEAINPSLPIGPFSGTHFSTPDNATGGQELRRVANSFEAFWGESSGLVNYSDVSVNEYAVGLVFLRAADQSLANGGSSAEGFGYLQASQTMLDIARGIQAGVMDSIQSIVKAIPALGHSLLRFGQLLYGDPEELYKSLYEVVVSIPDVAKALAKRFRADIASVAYGSTFERTKTISKLTTDVLVAYWTGAALNGAVVSQVTVVDSGLAEAAGHELIETVANADSFSSATNIRAAAVEPLVERVTIDYLIETSEFNPVSSNTVAEYYRTGGVDQAIKDFEALPGEEQLSQDGTVRYKDLTSEPGKRANLRITEESVGRWNDGPTLEIRPTGPGKKEIVFRYKP